MVTLAIILLTVSAVSGLLLVYPYLLYPRVLALLQSQPSTHKSLPHTTGSITASLLFCAFNEAASIDAKIANLRTLKARNPQLEVLAYDDGSDDGTRDKLLAASDVLAMVAGEGRTGKAAGMKRLAQLAKGEVLIFTDANVICREDIVERLLPYYGDPSVGGVCGTLVYQNEDWTPTAQIGAQYWSLDERLRGLESRTGNVMGADGSIFSIRKALYPKFPNTVLDDFVVSMSVVFAGKRLIKASDAVAYEESVALPDEEFRRKIRIGTRAYHTHLWMRSSIRQMSRRDRFKYVSRKYLRWFGGAFLIVSLVSGLAGLTLLSVWMGLAAALLCAILTIACLSARRGPFAKAGDVLRALIGTMLGVSRGMLGKTVQTWAPAASR